MARIFVSFFNAVKDGESAMPAFYESFLEGLRKHGNELLVYHHMYFNGEEFKKNIPDAHKKELVIFDPDLVILFNNNYYDVSKVIDCPIVIYEVDSPLYYANKEKLRQNSERYLFFVPQVESVECLNLDFGVSKSRIHLLPFFTEIQAEKKDQEMNISFIGSKFLGMANAAPWNIMHDFQPSLNDIQTFGNLLKFIESNPFYHDEDLSKNFVFENERILKNFSTKDAIAFLSEQKRVQALSEVADLGLRIYGNNAWGTGTPLNSELALCYSAQQVYSLKHNQDIYNSSKLCININHLQAVSGFSWRVCDVMASNGCLVSDYKYNFEKLFPNVPIYSFTNRFEARKVCLELLNDESKRLDSVAACQEVINERYRFIHCLTAMSEILGITLSQEKLVTNIKFMNVAKQEGLEKPKKLEKPENHSLLIRLKLMVLALMYQVTVIPGLSSVFTKKYDRDSLYNRITYNNYLLANIQTKSIKSIILKYSPAWLIPILVAGKKKYKKIILYTTDLVCKYEDKIEKYKEKSRIQLSKRELAKKMTDKHIQLVQELKNKTKIKVVFLVIDSSTWKLDAVFRKMSEDPYFDPIILVCPHVLYGDERMHEGIDETYHYFSQKGYPVLSSYDRDHKSWVKLKEISPDIIFFINPHNLTYQEYYEEAYLNYLSCFCGYGYIVSEYGDAIPNFNQYFHAALWKNFAMDEYSKKGFKKFSANRGANVSLTGFPAIERLLAKKSEKQVWKNKDDRLRIIFAPHHTIDANYEFQLSNFLRYYKFFQEMALKYQDSLVWCFKPHPLLKSKLYNHDQWGKEKTDEYYQWWIKQENTQFNDDEYDDLFIGSDAMIHDSGSFLIEYLTQRKPVLYLVSENTQTSLNTFALRALNATQNASNEEKIEEFIVNLMQGKTTIKEEHALFYREEFVDLYQNQTPSSRIIENIKQEILS